MPCIPFRFGDDGPIGHLTIAGEYKPGDPRPIGYLDREEWAEVQMKAGIEEARCGVCCKWRFEHELDPTPRVNVMHDSRGNPVEVKGRICLECAGTAG